MKVISGSLRGRKLEKLVNDEVRPTMAKIKESLFNIIQFRIEGRNFLDLFSGTDQIGIEALSRGASSAVFVDNDRRALDIINKNLKSCGLLKRSRIVSKDVNSFLITNKENFDIVFLDPPYKSSILNEVLLKVEKFIKESGIIVCECLKDHESLTNVGNFILTRRYKYGEKLILVYLNKKEVERNE